MKHAEQVTFGGSGLDRAAHIRNDPDRLAEIQADPEARCLLLWRGKPLVKGEALDRLALVPMSHGLVQSGPGGALDAPVVSGFDGCGVGAVCNGCLGLDPRRP